jgi:hypothetical protein
VFVSQSRSLGVTQLMGLTLAYAGGYTSEPQNHLIPQLVADKISEANTSKKIRKPA